VRLASEAYPCEGVDPVRSRASAQATAAAIRSPAQHSASCVFTSNTRQVDTRRCQHWSGRRGPTPTIGDNHRIIRSVGAASSTRAHVHRQPTVIVGGSKPKTNSRWSELGFRRQTQNSFPLRGVGLRKGMPPLDFGTPNYAEATTVVVKVNTAVCSRSAPTTACDQQRCKIMNRLSPTSQPSGDAHAYAISKAQPRSILE